MKKIKTLLLTLGSTAAAVAPALSISCGTDKEKERMHTATLVVNQASSMNFIRYNASSHLIAPTVLPLAVSMPPESIKNKYQLIRFSMSNAQGGLVSSAAYTYGAIEPSESGSTYQLDQSQKNIKIKLRKFMFWSNGDKIVAQNYVDTIKAILDINNASELVQKVKRYGFKNAVQALDAQTKYLLINGSTYKDPFNYNNLPVASGPSEDGPGKFPSILKPCLELGVEANGDYELDLRFDHKESLNFFSNINSQAFWPINRKHIMAHGGFDNFGKRVDSIISSGAYNVDYFDNKYGLEFSRNKEYYNASAVITPNINFRFVTDTNTKIAMYEDGQILQTPINRDFVDKFLSNPELKGRVRRSTGIGTIAMYLNQSPTNPNNAVLSDRHFRQALSYGINRTDLMQVMNLDYSNPVAIYTAASSTTPNGDRYLAEFKETKYKVDVSATKQKELPFMISPLESRGYAFQDDAFTRHDLIHNLDAARYAMKLAKEKHPGSFPVTLKFPYSSSDPFLKGVSIVINDYLSRAFGGDVIVDSKPLPTLVYQDWKSKGKWDMVIEQADPLTRRPWDYLGEFVRPDNPDASIGKTVGYLSNRSGAATYTNYFKDLNAAEEQKLKDDFNISDFLFDITKWFITYKTHEDKTNEFANENIRDILATYRGKSLGPLETKVYKMVNDFYASTFMSLMVESEKLEQEIAKPNYAGNALEERKKLLDRIISAKTSFFESTIPYTTAFGTVYKTMEKIQRDMIPVVPIAEADNIWSASRVVGATPTASGQWADPEYLYDGDHRPFQWLEQTKS